MTDPSIIDDILKELKRAKKKHPSWPQHIVARAAIVNEEAGELLKETLEIKYEVGKDEIGYADRMRNIKKEAVQTAAMAIRFLESL